MLRDIYLRVHCGRFLATVCMVMNCTSNKQLYQSSQKIRYIIQGRLKCSQKTAAWLSFFFGVQLEEGHSVEFVRHVLGCKKTPLWFLFDSVVLQHSIINPRIFTFNSNHSLRLLRFNDILVIAMWAILIRFLILCHVLSEGFLALFTQESHLHCFP